LFGPTLGLNFGPNLGPIRRSSGSNFGSELDCGTTRVDTGEVSPGAHPAGPMGARGAIDPVAFEHPKARLKAEGGPMSVRRVPQVKGGGGPAALRWAASFSFSLCSLSFR
jgi:hypothetical protein